MLSNHRLNNDIYCLTTGLIVCFPLEGTCSIGEAHVWFPLDITAINQNTTLTIIQDNPIIASHNKAFFNTFNQLSYHLLSAHDVSILNHQYRQKHNTIVAKIPKHQLIAFLITVNKFAFGQSSLVWIVFISLTLHFAQNQLQLLLWAKVIEDIVTIHIIANHNINLLMFSIYSKLLTRNCICATSISLVTKWCTNSTSSINFLNSIRSCRNS